MTSDKMWIKSSLLCIGFAVGGFILFAMNAHAQTPCEKFVDGKKVSAPCDQKAVQGDPPMVFGGDKDWHLTITNPVTDIAPDLQISGINLSLVRIQLPKHDAPKKWDEVLDAGTKWTFEIDGRGYEVNGEQLAGAVKKSVEVTEPNWVRVREIGEPVNMEPGRMRSAVSQDVDTSNDGKTWFHAIGVYCVDKLPRR